MFDKKKYMKEYNKKYREIIKEHIKTCLVCRKKFEPYTNKHKYCSKVCSKIGHNQTKKIYNSNHKFEIKEYKKNWLKAHEKTMLKYFKIYRNNHKFEIINYYQNNKEKILEQKKKYYQKHKLEIISKIVKYSKNRRKIDINYRLTRYLRTRIWFALKGIIKSESTIKLLGCSIEFFKKYYQSKFTKEMSWKKVMSGEIHCDHIRPCASFDLSKSSEQKKCFNYKNLQPLWAEENLSKGKKY